MKTEGTNLLLLTMSAFWSSSRWPRATLMRSRRQRSIPLGGRYRQVSLYVPHLSADYFYTENEMTEVNIEEVIERAWIRPQPDRLER